MQCITPTNFTVDDCLACSACIPDYKNITKYPEGDNIIYVFSTQSLLSLAKFYNMSFEIFERKFTFFMKKKLNAVFLLNMSFLRSTHLKLIYEEFTKNKLTITSSCPAIVMYGEKKYTFLLTYLSKIKSLHQLAFDYAKNKINSPHKICAVVPCLDKKLENIPYDFILTAKEFVLFINKKKLTFNDKIDEEIPDRYFKSYSIYGSSSGGYCEYLINQSNNIFAERAVRKNFTEYYDKKNNILIAKIFSLPNLIYLMKNEIHKYKFIELFLCKGCCDGPGLIKNEELENMWKNLQEDTLENFLPDAIFKEKRNFDYFKRKRINFSVDW